jgi:poly(A) polymerase
MQRLMAMIPRRLREVQEISGILRLSNAQQERLTNWADPALGHIGTLDAAGLAEAFYRHGAEAVCDRALIEAAAGQGESLKLVLAAARVWMRPQLPVGGADALSAGLTGPDVGKALAAAEEAWIASGFTLTRKALLARLNRQD